MPDWKKVSSAVNTDSTMGPVTVGLFNTIMKGCSSIVVSIWSTSSREHLVPATTETVLRDTLEKALHGFDQIGLLRLAPVLLRMGERNPTSTMASCPQRLFCRRRDRIVRISPTMIFFADMPWNHEEWNYDGSQKDVWKRRWSGLDAFDKRNGFPVESGDRRS